MKPLISRPLSRRFVLRGIGAAISLPLLEAMMPRAFAASSKFKARSGTAGPQPRWLSCYVPNGVNIHQWVPAQAGQAYTLSPTLKVLEAHRDAFTVMSGLGHPAAAGGHSGADTWLTGADLAAVPGSDYTNTVSADQLVADRHGKHTRFASLQLGDLSGTGSAGHSHTLSFSRAGTPLPTISSPRGVFDRLFVPETARDRNVALQRLAMEKSILDSVLGEARHLEQQLGKADQRKLDEYLTSVRETEGRVQRLKAWVDVPKVEERGGDLALAAMPANAHDRPLWLDTMLELTYLAFVTDSTRVITFEWSREASGFGGGGENHHELSHHGGDAGMLKQLAGIDRFHLQRLEHLLSLLKATSEADGNMLDRTIVLYGSGMNSGEGGEHSPKNLPTLVAGGKALGLRHGHHLAFDPEDHPPLSNLLLRLIQAMKVDLPSFGDSTEPLSGV